MYLILELLRRPAFELLIAAETGKQNADNVDAPRVEQDPPVDEADWTSGGIELATPLRQRHDYRIYPSLIERRWLPWERASLARLRAGDTDTALDTYIRQGRVEVASTGTEARSRMVGDWLDARRTGSAIMLSSRRVDVDALNSAARAALREDGTIGPDQIVIAGHGYADGDMWWPFGTIAASIY